MEIVEEVKNVLILNDEPEFSVCDDVSVSTSFFILCEEDPDTELSKNVYDCKIAGMSILNWVVRACLVQPKIIQIQKGANVIDTIKPFIDGGIEYSVVLYANTPLLNRAHIQDLLGFVSRKHFNACKLRRGFVFRNDYISQNNEIYSVDTYDFATNDFFEVKSYADLAYVKDILTKKVLAYHKKNGVYFENEQNLAVDATVEIGYSSEIASGAILSHSTIIGESASIAKNVTISGSKIGDDVTIGIGSIVIDSIIKSGSVIDAGVVIKNSIIGNNCKVGLASVVLESSVRDEAEIAENATIDNSRIGVRSKIGKHSKVLGIIDKTIVEQECDIGANVLISDRDIIKNTKIPANTILTPKAGA